MVRVRKGRQAMNGITKQKIKEKIISLNSKSLWLDSRKIIKTKKTMNDTFYIILYSFQSLSNTFNNLFPQPELSTYYVQILC